MKGIEVGEARAGPARRPEPIATRPKTPAVTPECHRFSVVKRYFLLAMASCGVFPRCTVRFMHFPEGRKRGRAHWREGMFPSRSKPDDQIAGRLTNVRSLATALGRR